MNCPECGEPISGDDKFCGECGAEVPQESESAAPEAQAPPPAEDTELVPEALPDEDEATLDEIEPVQPEQAPGGGLQEIINRDDEPTDARVEAEAEPLMDATPLPEPAPGPGPDVPPEPPPVTKAKGKSNTGLIIGIVVLVILLLCCCCALGVFVANFDEIAQTLETIVEATAIP